MSERILRLPGVTNKTGLSRSTIYSLMAQNKFPSSVALGARAVGWFESSINDWLENLAAK